VAGIRTSDQEVLPLAMKYILEKYVSYLRCFWTIWN